MQHQSFSLELVDIPGHERLRERIFNKYKDQLRLDSVILLAHVLTRVVIGL